MNRDELDEVFGPQGWLSRESPGYRPRPGQQAMAAEVARAIEEGAHFIVEGPTGTGKTIAYLVPTIEHIAREKARWLEAHPEPDPWTWDEEVERERPADKEPPPKAVIVTANIALQEQLVARDLPRLAQTLPWPFTFGLLKGRTNFLCKSMLGDQSEHDEPSTVAQADAENWRAIVTWGAATQTGDVSELSFQPSPALWALFSCPSDACNGRNCEHFGTCFPRRAAQLARSRDVLVTNYHILFTNVVVREETQRDLVVPPVRVAVLDEAHKAADIAREAFGFRVGARAIGRLAAALREFGEYEARDRLLRSADVFFQALGALKATPEGAIRLRQPNLVNAAPLCEALKAAENAYLAEVERIGKQRERTRRDLKRQADYQRRSVRCGLLSESIADAVALKAEGVVVFIEADTQAQGALLPPNPRGTLCTLPVDVGTRLARHLFQVVPTVVVTSATLAVGASRTRPFDLVRRELGIAEAHEAIVESPFDFQKQAMLVIPDDLPEPTDPRWAMAAARTVREVVRLAQGRTLGLFTSYSALRRAADRCQGLGFKVLVQGDGPRTALIRAFQEEVPSVLLGTESFWAGVDVPGESLSCVIIDRLPFPSPDDPVLDAIRERDPTWFRTHALPRSIIAFKQGFGRLISSVHDCGVVVLLDRRLVLRPYGRVFEASLPRMPRSYRLADVRAFLDARPQEQP